MTLDRQLFYYIVCYSPKKKFFKKLALMGVVKPLSHEYISHCC